MNKGRYAYSYELTTGDKGTWLTDVKPEFAKEELIKRFIGKEVKQIKIINK